MLIVKGNKEIAERYAVNIMSAYQHYRWRAYLKECAAKGISPWQGLKKSNQWQKKDAQHSLELNFWLNSGEEKSACSWAPMPPVKDSTCNAWAP